jgi:two-component system response regulator DctR
MTTKFQTNNPIIYVIDNDQNIRESFAMLFGDHGYGVSCHESADSFLRALPSNGGLNVSCALLEANLSDLSGIELQKLLIEQGHNIPIAFVTKYGDISTAVEAIKCGAFDFIQKPIQDDVLCKLVSEMLKKAKADRELSAEVKNIRALFKTLTSRELQILDLIVIGRFNREISAKLEIAIHTVEQHRANIMKKLKVKRPAGLLQFIYRHEGAKNLSTVTPKN